MLKSESYYVRTLGNGPTSVFIKMHVQFSCYSVPCCNGVIYAILGTPCIQLNRARGCEITPMSRCDAISSASIDVSTSKLLRKIATLHINSLEVIECVQSRNTSATWVRWSHYQEKSVI